MIIRIVKASKRPQDPQASQNIRIDSNVSLIARSEKEQVASDKPEKQSKIQTTFSTFQESSEVLLKILEGVESIHPCIGAAVLAFKVVINLELKRRGNNDKTKLLMAKVHEMMAILVQLRAIPDGTKARNQSITVAGKMEPLCIQIGEDIRNCGNLCDMYSKQILIVKILKASIYEERLADMGQKLDDRQKELHFALAMFTAETIHSLKDSIHSTLEGVNMLQLFAMSRSPLEQKLADFIESKGGAERCMEDPKILEELIVMRRNAFSRDEKEQNSRAGARSKHPSYYTPYGPYGGGPPYHLSNEEADSGAPARNLQGFQLKSELDQDIDESLRSNMVVFTRKFEEQRIQLEALKNTVVQQADRVIDVVQQGPHDRVIDEELRAIWKEMGWRLVVQTPKFALTLHDYFITQHHDMQLVSDHFNRSPSQKTTMKDEMTALAEAFALAKKRSEDKWALECLHISNMGPIREAFDADASGYVSVWEANQVLSLRPSGWSLLQWLAYWALGRQHTITQYTTKISDILKDMHMLLRTRVLPLNRHSVDHYLDGMKTLDRVLTSVTQVPPNSPLGGELAERVQQYTSTEEERMERVLQALKYEIDCQETIELITSRYHIERNFFPLVYLLLRQHLAIIHVGCSRLLDQRELKVARQSLKFIFRAVKDRVSILEDLPMFQIREKTGKYPLRKFAFGMYLNVFYKTKTFLDIPISDEKLVLTDPVRDPLAQTRSEPPQQQDMEDPANANDDGPLNFESCIGDCINGYWSGFFRDEGHNIVGGVVQFRVSDWSSRSFSGEGTYIGGTLRVEGTFDRDTGKVEVTIVGVGDAWSEGLDGVTRLHVSLSGVVEKVPWKEAALPNQYILVGTWRDAKSGTASGPTFLSQTPAWVHHLRWTPRESLDNQARCRWNFAIRAIFYRINSKRGFLDATYCMRKLEMIADSVQLLKHQKSIGSMKDEFTMELGMGTTRLLSPLDVRLCRRLAQTAWWPTVHFKSKCGCGMTVVGHRFFEAYSEGTKEHCPHESVLRHSGLIKSSRFVHRREVSELSSKTSV
ncbi:hypothetical protein PQX77_017201, partial [Marasmius sp. AFHP31]